MAKDTRNQTEIRTDQLPSMMTGPFPKGSYTGHILPHKRRNWGHLEPGRRYSVAREFADYDQDLHPVGESWIFLGYSFQHMDEGLSLYVSLDGEQEWYLPLQNGPEQQGEVMDYLEQYLVGVRGQ